MWLKVDDQMWAHPKVLDAGTDAMGLWVRAACWSVQHLTDGYVPEQIVLMLLGDSYWPRGGNLADKLVAAGLWVEIDDPAGYRFHDWDQYQPPATEVREKRRAVSEIRAAAGRKGAASRWQNDGKTDDRGSGATSAIPLRATDDAPISPEQSPLSTDGTAEYGKRDGKPMANAWQTDGPEPEPEPKSKSKSLARHVERQSDFDAFWSAYPRKVGKRTALAAYKRATKRASHQQILDGLALLLPTWTDPQYIPHPTTWLNRDGWNDEPTATGVMANLHDLGEQVRRLEEGKRFFG